METDISVIIMAGGLGKRMMSSIPKPFVEINKKPLIDYVIDSFKFSGIHDIFVVSHPSIVNQLQNRNVNIIIQHEPLGTFHAIYQALPYIKSKYVFIIPADKPVINSDDIKSANYGIFVDQSCIFGYRDNTKKPVLITEDNKIIKIAEDLSEIELFLHYPFRTGGIYKLKVDDLRKIELDKHITKNNKQNEYYLTDIIPFLKNKPTIFEINDINTVTNVNTPIDLNNVQKMVINEKILTTSAEAHARLVIMGRHIDHQNSPINVTLLPQKITCNISYRPDFYSRHIFENKYGKFYWSINDDIPNNSYKYIACVLKYLFLHLHIIPIPSYITIDGNIPEGCGLSSSSAIVVSVMKAVTKFNNIIISDFEMIKLCGESEKLIGTCGGYGDHASMILGSFGKITKIKASMQEIKIIRKMDINPDLGIVVINSGEVARKGFEMCGKYNSKVHCYKIGLENIGIFSIENAKISDLNKINESEVKDIIQYGIQETYRSTIFDSNKSLIEIAKLVNDSQFDEINLYKCSTNKIDCFISEIMNIQGVLAGQICGAGLGGCFMILYDKKYDILQQLSKYDIVSTL